MNALSLSGRIALAGADLFSGEVVFAEGWTCVMGASGVGKTTLLRVLAGLPVAATFQGHVARPGRIGWMAQADLLLPHLTVAGNVGVIDRLAGRLTQPDKVSACLDAVGLAGFEARMPDTLSGGQRQRVALARALMQEAPCLMLDEPFAALDPATRRQVQTTAQDLLRGKRVVMVTHDPSEALRLADRLLVLAGGALRDVTLPAKPRSGLSAQEAATALGQILLAMEAA
ncbi:ATP-binding cassette domain-containing protein [bacterium]|nr:ATP-binding cassette domain-containing protein [bacterium]